MSEEQMFSVANPAMTLKKTSHAMYTVVLGVVMCLEHARRANKVIFSH
jgi:hypothetical protein